LWVEGPGGAVAVPEEEDFFDWHRGGDWREARDLL
jgi:hypothetical protein